MTYEYQCPKCGKKFELWSRTFKHPEIVPCPKCRTESPLVMSVPQTAIYSPYLKDVGTERMMDY